jgi:ribose transport system ATP-binding protein
LKRETRAELYKIILRSARQQGRAVLFASSDHDEVVALADRAIVLEEGRVVAEFTRDALTEDSLIHAAHLDKSSEPNGKVREVLPGEVNA